jgi:hypothetical protein
VNVIGTKWGFKNKQGKDGEVVRNKARLVAQGYSQVEGLDFRETRGFLVFRFCLSRLVCELLQELIPV